jgi:hypothetical protein
VADCKDPIAVFRSSLAIDAINVFLGNQEGRAPTLIALNKSMYMQERCRNAGSVKTGITKEKKRNSETIQ